MAVRIHTAQLNVGKKLKEQSNVLFIDVTRKSGTGAWLDNFAPTKDLLWQYKSENGISEEEYTKQYLTYITSFDDDLFDKFLKRVADGKSPFTDIVLGCYCGAGKFCHRHLLQRYLVERYGFEMGYEITSKDVIKETVPSGSVISLSCSEDVQAALIERYQDYSDVRVVWPVVTPEGDNPMEEKLAKLEALRGLIAHAKLMREEAGINAVYVDTTGIAEGIIGNPTVHAQAPYLRSKLYNAGLIETEEEAIEIIKSHGYVEHVRLDKSLEQAEIGALMDTHYRNWIVQWDQRTPL